MRHQTGGHRHSSVDVLHQPADAQARWFLVNFQGKHRAKIHIFTVYTTYQHGDDWGMVYGIELFYQHYLWGFTSDEWLDGNFLENFTVTIFAQGQVAFGNLTLYRTTFHSHTAAYVTARSIGQCNVINVVCVDPCRRPGFDRWNRRPQHSFEWLQHELPWWRILWSLPWWCSVLASYAKSISANFGSKFWSFECRCLKSPKGSLWCRPLEPRRVHRRWCMRRMWLGRSECSLATTRKPLPEQRIALRRQPHLLTECFGCHIQVRFAWTSHGLHRRCDLHRCLEGFKCGGSVLFLCKWWGHLFQFILQFDGKRCPLPKWCVLWWHSGVHKFYYGRRWKPPLPRSSCLFRLTGDLGARLVLQRHLRVQSVIFREH